MNQERGWKVEISLLSNIIFYVSIIFDNRNIYNNFSYLTMSDSFIQ